MMSSWVDARRIDTYIKGLRSKEVLVFARAGMAPLFWVGLFLFGWFEVSSGSGGFKGVWSRCLGRSGEDVACGADASMHA